MFTYILAYLTELPNVAKSLCYSTQFRVQGSGCLADISTGVTTFDPKAQATTKTHYAWLDKSKCSYQQLSATNPEVYLQIDSSTNKPTGVGLLPADYQLQLAGKLDDQSIATIPVITETVDEPVSASVEV